MRAVLQRVTHARVVVDGKITGEIGAGLVVLIAVGRDDVAATAGSLAEKIVNLRIFNDEEGKMNRRRDSGRIAIHLVRRRAWAAQAEFHPSRAAGFGQSAVR